MPRHFRHNASRLVLVSAAVIANSIAFHGAAQAQTATAQTAAEEDDLKLREIIVTADKRSVNLQDAGQAISAVDAANLDRTNISNLSDLTGFAPSLVVTKEEGFNRAVTIRGLGKANTQAGIGQSVALHQDGVFFADTVSLNVDLIDVNRIEILRGPQGTVYGQNAIGGVLNIITNQPRLGVLEGAGDIAVGSYDTVQARAVLNVPIGERFAIRLTGQKFEHDGYSTNLFNGEKLDEEDNLSGRVQVLWRPIDDLDITARYQAFDTDVNGQALKSIFDPAPDPRRLSHNFPDLFAYSSQVASTEIALRQSWFTAKFIGSYQTDRTRNQLDLDRGTNAFTNFIDPTDTFGIRTGVITDDRIIRNNTDRDTYTAELNIASVEGGAVDWIVGAFYAREERDTDYLELTDGSRDGVVDSESTIRDLIARDGPFAVFDNLDSANGFQTSSNTVDKAFALYGQLTWNVTDSLRLTGGLRYNDTSSQNSGSIYFGLFPSTNGTDDKLWTGKASVEYDITPEILTYATYTRGAKPGAGSLSGSDTGEFVRAAFRPETVNAYEVGFKSRFLEDRVQLNSAAYYYDFSNFQVIGADPQPFGAGVINIPKSRNYGLELEASALATDRLRFDFSGAYQNSEITSDYLAIDGVRAIRQNGISFVNGFGLFSPENIAARTATAQNLRGNRLPRTPKFQFNATASYSLDIVESEDLPLSANYNWIDDVVVRPFANPERDFIPSYGLFNLSANFVYNEWTFLLTASNLFNKDAINNRFTDAFGVAATADTLVPPRIVKFRVGYSF
jgi:iron complex outermembrane recepter protein